MYGDLYKWQKWNRTSLTWLNLGDATNSNNRSGSFNYSRVFVTCGNGKTLINLISGPLRLPGTGPKASECSEDVYPFRRVRAGVKLSINWIANLAKASCAIWGIVEDGSHTGPNSKMLDDNEHKC